MSEIDFSDPTQVESAITAINMDVKSIKAKANEEKEKYDAIFKAMKSNDKLMKEMANAMEDDEDLKKAVDEDEDIKAALKKAQEDNDKKETTANDDKEKEAEDKEDVKASIKIAKAKYVSDLTASFKLMNQDSSQRNVYSASLQKLSLTALQKEYDNPYRQTLEGIIKAQIPQTAAQIELPQNIPFNAILSQQGQAVKAMILEDELVGVA